MENYIQIAVISLRSPSGKVIDNAPMYAPLADKHVAGITAPEAVALNEIASILDRKLQEKNGGQYGRSHNPYATRQ